MFPPKVINRFTVFFGEFNSLNPITCVEGKPLGLLSPPQTRTRGLLYVSICFVLIESSTGYAAHVVPFVMLAGHLQKKEENTPRKKLSSSWFKKKLSFSWFPLKPTRTKVPTPKTAYASTIQLKNGFLQPNNLNMVGESLIVWVFFCVQTHITPPPPKKKTNKEETNEITKFIKQKRKERFPLHPTKTKVPT